MSKPSDKDESKATMPVVEEILSVGKRKQVTAVWRVSKQVHEDEEVFEEPVETMEVEVKRVSLDRWVDAPPPVRRSGNTTVYPVLREVLVVEKRLKLVEEVHVTRRYGREQASGRVGLRREDITVDRVEPETPRSPSPGSQSPGRSEERNSDGDEDPDRDQDGES